VTHFDDEHATVPGEDLEAALDAGATEELPENQPRGILGERGLDLRKVDDFSPDLNAGISQENDTPVMWLAVIVAYLVFFPLAYWILWRTPLFSRRVKVVTSVIGGIGILTVAGMLMRP